jgi:hypothetical protein
MGWVYIKKDKGKSVYARTGATFTSSCGMVIGPAAHEKQDHMAISDRFYSGLRVGKEAYIWIRVPGQ